MDCELAGDAIAMTDAAREIEETDRGDCGMELSRSGSLHVRETP